MRFKHPSHVPDYPETDFWVDQLRWAVTVMNDDDGALGFVTSVLAYCVDNDGITKKQGDAVGRILRRLRQESMAGVLDCQINDEDGEITAQHAQEARTLQ